jgi:F0F1-type ATP synthase delta subunit
MSKLSRRVIARTVAAKLLAEPAKRKHWLQVAAAYLIEHNQAGDIDLLVNDIAHEVFEQSGKLFVDVTSARPLTDGVRSELKRLLSDATSATQVDLTEHIDKDLLGGLIARTPSAELDTSVRSKLRQLATLK